MEANTETLLKLHARSIDKSSAPNERAAARKALITRLNKAGLTLEQLLDTDLPKKIYWYAFADATDKVLLWRIYQSYLQEESTKRENYNRAGAKSSVRRRQTREIGFLLTAVEHADLTVLVETYRKAWKVHVAEQFDMFLIKHRLRVESAVQTTYVSAEEYAEYCRKMSAIDDIENPLVKRISDGK